jgi:cell volume regulation protein A
VDDILTFGVTIGVVCLVLFLAVLSNRVSDRVGVPAPAFFLVGAAIVSDLAPGLAPDSIESVQRIVTVGLIAILFNGGLELGWPRFRANVGAIAWVGVVGTFVTAAALAVAGHYVFGFDWMVALLIGTALAPTDPAVVFSVLGRREIAGRSGTILEGESGVNDPVGIALMVALLTAATSSGGGAALTGVEEFTVQMAVGAVVGLLGGRLMVAALRLPLPSEGLYVIRSIALVGLIYGAAVVARGSGFLAVFLAGMVVADARAPYKRDVERFHTAAASLGEIVAFTVLGLTVNLRNVLESGAWAVGLGLAVIMAFFVRPVLVGLVLWPVRLQWGERLFVLWAGLKGAVPILLGTYILTSGQADPVRAYGIVFVVVLFSVVVQGGLVPVVARWLRLPITVVEQEPWALGMRFRDEPQGLRRYTVTEGAPADGRRLDELTLGENVWISLVGREGSLVQARGETRLQAGDEVLVLVDASDAEAVGALFTEPVSSG